MEAGFKQRNRFFCYQPVPGGIGVKTVIQKVFSDGIAGLIAKGMVEIQAGNIVLFSRSG
jgi:hypothetical protein